MRRRDALIIGGAMAVAVAIPPILRRIPSAFDFEPLPGFDGFRRLSGGSVSGGVNPFVGLDSRLPAPADPEPEFPASPCQALFGTEGWTQQSVPVAMFSDFNCPYCKTLEGRLVDIADSGAPIRLVWHEMPIRGPSSYRASQAILAARFLGAEAAARRYLWQNAFRPGPQAQRRMAEVLEIDPDLFQREIKGPRVARALADSLALGGLLGLPGTPGTVIGRTLVIGAISETDIKKLIRIEAEEPQNVCS